MGDKINMFRYGTNPRKKWKCYVNDFKHNAVEIFGISVQYESGIKIRLSEDEYIDLIERFGKMAGFKELKTVMIHDRI